MNFSGFVGSIVIQDQMNRKVGLNGTIDLIQELARLHRPMARPALPDYRSGGDIQGSEESGCAMALVVVRSAFDLAEREAPVGLLSAWI